MQGAHVGDAAVNRLIGVLGRRFRQRRMSMFIDTLKPNRETRILDVGGTVAFWVSSGVISPIVVLNPAPWAAGDGPENISFTERDGTATGYRDHEFDIVFSNSVIEHLGTIDEQPVSLSCYDTCMSSPGTPWKSRLSRLVLWRVPYGFL